MKNKIFLIILLLLPLSCGGFSDAGKVLRNEKTITTDEFLIKKREPLVLPPDYRNLPAPAQAEKKEEEQSDLKKILRVKEEKKINKSNNSIENSIIEKITK